MSDNRGQLANPLRSAGGPLGVGAACQHSRKAAVIMGRRLPVDQEAVRADTYRGRAIELAMQAKREDDPGQRRFLLDKARTLVNVADAMDPQPPDEPQVFRNGK
jgi:hypothetical protein